LIYRTKLFTIEGIVMNHEIEQEHTFLLNSLPADIQQWEQEFLADTYIPESSNNPQIRLRQRGEAFFITKKYPKNEGDLSVMVEETIHLSPEEYKQLKEAVPGKYLAKIRYKKVVDDMTLEIDVYQEALSPLVILDIEWRSREPDDTILRQFDIQKEVTQIHKLAAGQMAGKAYEQIKPFIK